MGDIVHLNVGGTVYTTRRATLTAYEDSMLEKMFNGTWEETQDDQGRCFVDRDGSLFRYVLNFLRTGDLVIPDEFPELQLLRSEADFYQICPLIEAVDSEIQRRESLKPKPEPVRNSNRVYHLDVVEKTTFTGCHVGAYTTCLEEMIICGHVDVVKCLPLGKHIESILNYTSDGRTQMPTISVNFVRGYSYTMPIHVVRSGDSTKIFAETSQITEDSPHNCFLDINRAQLADALLANNCSLISSSSDLCKLEPITEFQRSEFQCCEKWSIPEESLPLLAMLKLPKL